MFQNNSLDGLGGVIINGVLIPSNFIRIANLQAGEAIEDLMIGWNLSTLTYDSTFLAIIGQGGDGRGIFVHEEGEEIYFVDYTNNNVFQYTLGTPYDVSSGTHIGTFPIGSEATQANSLSFDKTGTYMYIGDTVTSRVYQYTLGTPWDVSSAVYNSKFLTVTSEVAGLTGAYIKRDGTQVFVHGLTSDKVFMYNLSTAFDLSTGSYSGDFISILAETSYSSGVFFNDDGSKMYISANLPDYIWEYDMSVEWDITTAVYNGIFKDVGTEDGFPMDFCFKKDGTIMYLMGRGNDKIFQYTLTD